MKKKISIIVLSLFFLCYAFPVYAKEYIVLNSAKSFREKIGGKLISSVGDEGVLPKGSKVEVLDKNYGSGNGCQNSWYKVSYQGKEGFICSSDQQILVETEIDLNGSFEKEMLQKGFDQSFLPYLKNLHEKHPNWVFTRVNTGLDFNEAIRNENIGEMSLVNGSDSSLRKKDDYGRDIPSVNESGWYVASDSTVSYYMDARNFLSEEYAFMFLNLKYNKETENKNTVKGVTAGTFLNTDEYLNYFMKAASTTSVSPVYLASRVRQEKGVNGGTGTDGASFTFAVDNNCMRNYADRNSWTAKNNCGTGKMYSGYYNFYNIGAYGSYQSPVIRGLIWGMGGFDNSVSGYQRPWNTKEKAIVGGAEYINSGYISANQHTLYFQKFNVAPGALHSTYTHQYMANVKAHASEALSMYKGYRDSGLLNGKYEFLIPTFYNMPNTSSVIVPDKGGQAPSEVPNMDLANGVVASGYRLNNEYLSNIEVGTTIDTLKGRLQATNGNLTVTSFKDKYGNNASSTIGTGDRITISNGKNSTTYTAIIYGDNNGDGKTSVLDLLRVQKYLLGMSNLTDAEMVASDTNKDGLITVIDLLRVQKQLLGYSKIEQ